MAHQQAAGESVTAGEASFQAKAHADVDCSGIQQWYIEHPHTGQSLSLHYMPLVSDTSVMAMWAIPEACLGEKGEYMVDCGDIPCQEARITAWMKPADYCPPPEVIDFPIYRSLGASSDDEYRTRSLGADEEEVVPAPIVLDHGRCLVRGDGSSLFTLKTSRLLLSEEEIAQAIKDRKYKDKPQYLSELGKGCMNELLRNMRENNVKVSNVFEMDEEDDTQVDALAHVSFLDNLLPNLRLNQDMIVVIPSFSEDGKPQMSGAFSMAFLYPEMRKQMPMLGLVHNVDPCNPSSEQEVEGSFFVMSNKEFPMRILNDETGVTTEVGLQTGASFLPEEPRRHHRGGRRGESAYYRSLTPPEIDYDAWQTACMPRASEVDVAARPRHRRLATPSGQLYSTNPSVAGFPTLCLWRPDKSATDQVGPAC